MTQYAKIEGGAIGSVSGHPGWRNESGPLSDTALAAHGYLPIVRAPVGPVDDLLATLTWDERTQWVIYPDRVVQPATITPRPLIEVKVSAARLIDQMADSARGAFVTQGGPGQALEYDQTRREIDAWQAAENPDITDYPMLAAEWRARRIAEPDITVAAALADAVAELGIWHVVGPAIKEARRTGKVATEIARTPARVRQIVDWAGVALASAATAGAFDPLTPEAS